MIRKLIAEYYKLKNVPCDNPHESLQVLQKITDELPDWHTRWVGNGDRMAEIDCIRGSCRILGLHNEPDFAVGLCIQEADTFMECHAHSAIEFVVCVEGMARLCFDDNDHVDLYPGMGFTVPSHVNHSAFFPEYTRTIAITVPALKGFPAGGRWSHKDKSPAEKDL